MFTAFGFAWIGDKYNTRAIIIAIQSMICLVGLMLIAYVENHGVRYFGVFLGMMGGQGNIPAILTYQANNIRMQSKRSTASALQIGFGAIGGIIASTVFRQQDSPRYVIGLWVSAGLQLYTLCVLAVASWCFRTVNKRADRQGTPIEGQIGFRYTI